MTRQFDQVPEQKPVSVNDETAISQKHGAVTAQEVKTASGPVEMPPQFPNTAVAVDGKAEGRTRWEPPKYYRNDEPIGLSEDGKTLKFGGYYTGQLERYTASSDYLEHVKDITKLDLRNYDLTGDAAHLISQYPNVKDIALSGTKIREAMPHLSSMPMLERASLVGGYLKDEDVQNVAKVGTLTNIDLRNNYQLTDQSLKSLSTMPNLKSLAIDSSHVTPDGLKELSKLPLEKLTPPLFFEPKDADQAAKAFAGMRNLKELNLSLTRMTDEGVAQLAKSNSLEKLNLSNAFNITAASIDSLSSMTNLKELDLSSASMLRPSEIDRLKAALPNCNIKTGSFEKGIDASPDDRREASNLAHDMWLLAGITSAPERFASQLLEDFSKMSKTQIDLTAKLLESGPHHAVVKRDAQNNVESIAYNYYDESLKNCLEHPLPGVLFVPEAASRVAGRALNRGFGNDVTVQFKGGNVSLEARQYHDITGKGFFKGTDKMSVPYKPVIQDSRVPYYRP